MNKTELLKVLDISEDEQYNSVMELQGWPDESLADLAFRLRDEFVLSTPYSNRYAYNNAFEIVYEHEKEMCKMGTDKAGWRLDWSQPIHWIIASLIAKGE